MYFRTRIISISLLTVSVVLAIVITLSWSRIMQVELNRLDARLCMEARRLIPRVDANGSPRYRPIANGSRPSDGQVVDELVNKLRVSSPNEIMIYLEAAETGVLRAPEGVDIEAIINTVSWPSAAPLTLADKSQPKAFCQVGSFEHEQKQWRSALLNVRDQRSFIGVDVAATTRELKSTLNETLIVIIPFSFLLSLMGSWVITSHTVRPINRLHRSMGMVTEKELSHRLPEHKEDKEFQRLIDAYNTMLDRLEDSFQQVSRFTADAAHELKTPLTVLRGKLEQAVLAENPSLLDLNAILDEVGHLSAITRKLLLLSQADSGSMALHLEAINMTDLLDELTSDMGLLSEELVQDCSIDRDLITPGDRVLLTQLLNNLLVNVMRYSLPEKGVTIHACEKAAIIEVVISNVCLPLSELVRSQLFERFYRGESAQTQGVSGSGLGLSLAREIARAHGGDLMLEPSAEDRVVMKLVLPSAK
ncbi:HAMP domain-containing protein [Amphritea opalescens]|uniref:histidine kinase n=1 Tax=Amphritea opalescens TaxID=2490544 RepID=A0A430KV60_9GAMM|nr:ATP-binding protein [Amphritea opalescens]RTE67401.1 HAMP domain-containing protein [Amphritea opalescens]